MRARLLGVLLLALTLALPGWAQPATAPTLAELQRQIVQVAVLRGEFVQEKQVPGFRQPLRSQGDFLLARERGVLWQTRKPFPSELVLTRDRILSRQPDGRSRVELDARQQPALATVNATMFALLRGDLQALTARFALQPEWLAGGSWRLRLTPKSGALAQAFSVVTLEGDRYVRRVELVERGGARSVLTFSALRESPAQLSADEARHFD